MEIAFCHFRTPFRAYLCVLCVCLLKLHSHGQLASECYPGGHRILRNPYRSVSFDSTELQNSAIQDLICDHSLPAGWYRFMINNRPAEMPTSCVEMNKCGTQAPVWLSLTDETLPRPGEARQLSACATWRFFHSSAKDCCLFRIPVTVRNCVDFYLYHLQPTQGCMGYCAKVVTEFRPKLCPPGEMQVNGTCQASIPSLSSKPVVTPELIGRSVHLRCTYRSVVSDLPVGYLVVWAWHSASGVKEEIRRDSTLQTSVLVEMDGVHFKLGDTISCSVSAFLRNSTSTQSVSRESDGFYAGIKYVPDVLHIAEDGKEHRLTILSTVPIPCHGTEPNRHCRLKLHLNVDDPDSLGQESPNVALSDCLVELQPMACRQGSCAWGSLLLTAVTDFTHDGNRSSRVGIQPAQGSPRLWRGYTPASLKVMVQDIPTASCYSMTDPHIITFDGRLYDNHQTGTFMLYESRTRKFEVQVRQWDCGSRHHAGACNCGVAAREGNTVVTFDMCHGQPQKTRPRLSVRSLGPAVTERVKILKMNQGKKLTVVFSSGTSVRADVSDWGMSLSLRAPSMDFNATWGLCGTFDRSAHNDFQGPGSSSYGASDLENFIQEWRIAPGESLFDTSPPAVKDEIKRNFCRCQRGYGMSLSVPGSGDSLFSSPPSASCLSRDNVDNTFVFAFVDVTSEYVNGHRKRRRVQRQQASRGSAEVLLPTAGPREDAAGFLKPFDLEGALDEDSLGRPRELAGLVNDTGLGREKARGRRKREHELRPDFPLQSLSQSDLESFTYFFPGDHQSENRKAANPTWPTPSGLTVTRALEVCRLALANSTVGTVCQDLLGRRLDEAVDLCVLDLQLKDNLDWADGLVPLLENECERRLLENRTRRSQELGSSGGSPGQVASTLWCFGACGGDKLCAERDCGCVQGLQHCGLTKSQPVELTHLEKSGLCDIRTSDCESVRVFGLGFADTAALGCRATRLTYVNGEWIPGEEQRTQATFLSTRSLDCAIPPLSGPDMEAADFMVDDKPLSRWEVEVTNDGYLYSEPKVLMLYDGLCQVCDSLPSGLCKLKEKTCNIDGMCFAEGESSLSSSCLLCKPSTSKFTWSVNEVNQPPVYHAQPGGLQTFVGENFVYQFSATDPEGSAVLFLLESGPSEASLSPAGLLIWKVLSEETQAFRFTVSDECNALSRYVVQVRVKPCGCLNGGTCVTDISFPPGSGGYLCICPAGLGGHRCQEDTDECLSSPCGAGTCRDMPHGFLCQCPAGLRGVRCQEDFNECERSPCFPGVLCINSFGSYKCGRCPADMEGDGMTCKAPSRPDTTSLLHTLHPVLGTEIAGPSLPDTPRAAVKAPITVTLPSSIKRADPSSPIDVTDRCSSRPCYPGVQCIDRRPPYVGYVCGRCPPGLHGNGRVCTKLPRPGSPHVAPRLTQVKNIQTDHSNRGPSLHVPATPWRQGERRLTPPKIRTNSSGTRPLHAPVLGPVSERRETAPQPPSVPVTPPIPHNKITTRSHLSRHSGNEDNASITSHNVMDGWKELGDTSRRPVAMETRPLLSPTATPSTTAPRPSLSRHDGRSARWRHTVTEARGLPQTPLKTGRALTSALTYSSTVLTEPEFSADGALSRADPELSHGPWVRTTAGRRVPSSTFDPAITPHLRRAPQSNNGIIPEERSLTCTDMPCFSGVHCEPSKEGGFRCGRCPLGYVGDGRTCRAVCRHPCGKNMECAAPNTCRCKPGYAGHNCHIAVCAPDCRNGGMCIAPGVCDCTEGYHGETCETALCSRPCEHGGTCIGRNACSCTYGFVGPRCETMVCNRHCHNGGECASPDECQCQSGWIGPSCETALCSPVCLNGGSCLRPNTCACPPGFYGTQCQIAVCNPPCLNSGHCMRNNVCSCPAGYTGGRCEKTVCYPMCVNGGRCVGPDVCDCPSGWRGKRCDKPTCLQKCLNGGECIGPNACHCSPGWQGTLCQVPVCAQKCLYGSRCIRPNVCACRSGYSGVLCAVKLPIGRG